MWRLLHVIAIAALIGSAAYVYSVKYQTIYASEEIVKTRHLIAKERDAINLLRAEYAHLTRPDRLQELADAQLDMQPLALNQIVKADDLPDPAAQGRFDRPQARVARPARRLGDAERRRHRRHALGEVSHDRDAAPPSRRDRRPPSRRSRAPASSSRARRRWRTSLFSTRLDKSAGRIRLIALAMAVAYLGIGGEAHRARRVA